MVAVAQRSPNTNNLKRLYGMAKNIWPDNKKDTDENLHALVEGVTGKASISKLTDAEFVQAFQALEEHMALRGIPGYSKAKATPQRQNISGMATKLEQDKMWKLMYLIIGCDEKPDKTTAGARMCGAVKEILGMDVGLEKTLDWVKKEQAFTMIESLKGYLKTAQKEKAAREAAGR